MTERIQFKRIPLNQRNDMKYVFSKESIGSKENPYHNRLATRYNLTETESAKFANTRHGRKQVHFMYKKSAYGITYLEGEQAYFIPTPWITPERLEKNRRKFIKEEKEIASPIVDRLNHPLSELL